MKHYAQVMMAMVHPGYRNAMNPPPPIPRAAAIPVVNPPDIGLEPDSRWKEEDDTLVLDFED